MLPLSGSILKILVNIQKRNLNNLLQILEKYRKCASLYDMQSWNMGEYAKNLLIETKKQRMSNLRGIKNSHSNKNPSGVEDKFFDEHFSVAGIAWRGNHSEIGEFMDMET